VIGRDKFDYIVSVQGEHRAERQLNGGVMSTMPKRATATTDSGTNVTHLVVFDDPAAPDGFFKPASGLDSLALHRHDQDRQSATANECAAWQLARRLGEPYSEMVAPAIFRQITIDGEDLEGAISQDRGDRDFDAAVLHGEEQVMAAGFFDALIGQQDRHQDQHAWSDGRLYLFDHGFAFPSDRANHLNTAFWDFRLGRDEHLTDPERLAAQKVADSTDLLGIEPMLRPASADALRERAARVAQDGKLPRPKRKR
jgi:hypothetical protein